VPRAARDFVDTCLAHGRTLPHVRAEFSRMKFDHRCKIIAGLTSDLGRPESEIFKRRKWTNMLLTSHSRKNQEESRNACPTSRTCTNPRFDAR
jgi:hypothetical protein